MSQNRPEGEQSDLRLLAELTAAFSRAEQPPPHVVAAAKAVFALRALDAELALLTWDSEVDASLTTTRLQRQPDGPRSMTFELEGLAIEVELGPAATGRPLVGQLVPPQPAQVLVSGAGGDSARLHADDLGRFVLDTTPPGPLRLRVQRAGRIPVVTSWVRVD